MLIHVQVEDVIFLDIYILLLYLLFGKWEIEVFLCECCILLVGMFLGEVIRLGIRLLVIGFVIKVLC